MRSIIAIILLSFVAGAPAEDDRALTMWVNKLVDRALTMWPLPDADVDNTTLAKLNTMTSRMVPPPTFQRSQSVLTNSNAFQSLPKASSAQLFPSTASSAGSARPLLIPHALSPNLLDGEPEGYLAKKPPRRSGTGRDDSHRRRRVKKAGVAAGPRRRQLHGMPGADRKSQVTGR